MSVRSPSADQFHLALDDAKHYVLVSVRSPSADRFQLALDGANY